MLARRVPSILPSLSVDEQIDVTKIWSAAGLTPSGGGLIADPPFRAPHHSISDAALVGGGAMVRPGEVSLAHRGVLFIDELPELPRRLLESLRQPLEDREVTIARARHVIRLPAAFVLIAAANPCPCGWYGDPSGRCNCGPVPLERYSSRLSGPLLDRIDLVVEAPAVQAAELMSDCAAEPSSAVRDRVCAARQHAGPRGVSLNAALTGKRMKQSLLLTRSARRLVHEAADRMRLSARVVDRTLRVARTIADLSGVERVGDSSVAEALQYRPSSAWSDRGL